MSLFRDEMDVLQKRAISLIRPLIPADAQDRVARAYRQFNQIVRKHIRTETGLVLSDEDGKGSVPVRIVDGFPLAVVQLITRHDDPTLWRLIVALPKLANATEGLDLLIANWREFEAWPLLPPVAKGSAPGLIQSAEVARALQHLAITKQIFEELKIIQEDILGIYRFDQSRPPAVEIYWMAHALFAGAFGLRIEDLTVVTLAHELSHAYTHVGRDIDGKDWATVGFQQSELALVEGLAQFYTAQVARRLSIRAPAVATAFDTLLKHQSDVYNAHTKWTEESESEPGESVRFTMLRARRRGKVTHADWIKMLGETKKTLQIKS